jgi:fructokinase
MKVLGFGAILWDRVVGRNAGGNACHDRMTIGGSVFNVIAHLRNLGNEASMLTALADDELGRCAREEVARRGIRADFIGAARAPTCCIEVRHDENGLPRYSSPDLVSWDQVEIGQAGLMAIDREQFDCVVFGTLEQRSQISRQTLWKVLDLDSIRTRFVDLTLRGNFYSRELLDRCLRRATIAKMNEEEALVLAGMFGLGERDPGRLVPRISLEFGPDITCITLGERGAFIGDRGGSTLVPGYPVMVEDTIGSGDAFSAGLLHSLALGAPALRACEFANRMGALIASLPGAVPDYRLSDIDAVAAGGGSRAF